MEFALWLHISPFFCGEGERVTLYRPLTNKTCTELRYEEAAALVKHICTVSTTGDGKRSDSGCSSHMVAHLQMLL